MLYDGVLGKDKTERAVIELTTITITILKENTEYNGSTRRIW